MPDETATPAPAADAEAGTPKKAPPAKVDAPPPAKVADPAPTPTYSVAQFIAHSVELLNQPPWVVKAALRTTSYGPTDLLSVAQMQSAVNNLLSHEVGS